MDFDKQYWAVLLAAAAEIPGVLIAMYCVAREELGRRLSMAAFFLAAALIAVAVVGLLGPMAVLGATGILKSATKPCCSRRIYSRPCGLRHSRF
jgi:hypothetical protein